MKRTSRPVRAAAAAATVLLLVPAIAAGLNVDQPTFVDDIAPILHRELRLLPPARRDRTDVAAHLPRSAALGTFHRPRGREPRHAALGRGPGLRAVGERHQPERQRDRGDHPLGRDRRAARRGRRAGLQPSPRRTSEWTFGEPDWVYEFDPYEVTADGPDEFLDIPIKTGFEEDRWIQRGRSPGRRPHRAAPLHPLAGRR